MRGNMRLFRYLEDFKSRYHRAPRVGFVGMGISNSALLADAAGCPIIVRLSTEATLTELPDDTRILCGKAALSDIDEDILIFSPSARRDTPELLAARGRGAIFLSDAELYFLDHGEQTYAISGSDGKSTTATLTRELLKERHPDTELIGNIGMPFATARESCPAVAELSSFQLTYMRPRVRSALLTPITENHLDWHTDLDEYVDSKLNLLLNARRRTATPDSPISARVLKDVACDAIYSIKHTYDELRREYKASSFVTVEGDCIAVDGKKLLPVSNIKRKEPHNIHNLMGAVAATLGECSAEHVARVAREFDGLEHRIEYVGSAFGTDFINSSIDTTPTRAASTIEALVRPIRIILGGRGKKLSMIPAIEPLSKYATRISLYGEAAHEYYPVLNKCGITDRIECDLFNRLSEAIEHATYGICEGFSPVIRGGAAEAVLLCPAATGYGEFRNFADRGRYFKQYIKEKYKTQLCERK